MAKRPNAGEIKAATIIVDAYRKLLTALGHPDELSVVPREIEAVALIIAAHREG